MALVALGVTGFLDAIETVTRQSVMQLAAPPEMRGRVMANMSVITTGVSPLAQTQSGALAGLIGAPAAILLAAGVLGAGAVALGRGNRTLWRFSTSAPPGARRIDAASGAIVPARAVPEADDPARYVELDEV
jgi:hypothetical protein